MSNGEYWVMKATWHLPSAAKDPPCSYHRRRRAIGPDTQTVAGFQSYWREVSRARKAKDDNH